MIGTLYLTGEEMSIHWRLYKPQDNEILWKADIKFWLKKYKNIPHPEEQEIDEWDKNLNNCDPLFDSDRDCFCSHTKYRYDKEDCFEDCSLPI